MHTIVDDGREVLLDLLHVRDEVGSDDEHLGPGVVDDLRDLCRRQPPVDRDADRVELGQREQHLEVLRPVLVEERHSVAGADPDARERVGDMVRALVQRPEGDGASLEVDRRRFGLVPGLRANDVSDRPDRH